MKTFQEWCAAGRPQDQVLSVHCHCGPDIGMCIVYVPDPMSDCGYVHFHYDGDYTSAIVHGVILIDELTKRVHLQECIEFSYENMFWGEEELVMGGMPELKANEWVFEPFEEALHEIFSIEYEVSFEPFANAQRSASRTGPPSAAMPSSTLVRLLQTTGPKLGMPLLTTFRSLWLPCTSRRFTLCLTASRNSRLLRSRALRVLGPV